MVGLSLIFALATVEPTEYPAQAVWEAFVSYCKNESDSRQGWGTFDPESKPDLAYIVQDPRTFVTGQKYEPATVHYRVVKGRKLFALTHRLGRRLYCQLYDFDALENLRVSEWSKLADAIERPNPPEFTQTLEFGSSVLSGHSQGAIILHQPNYFPMPDSVGFVGLKLVAISEERP